MSAGQAQALTPKPSASFSVSSTLSFDPGTPTPIPHVRKRLPLPKNDVDFGTATNHPTGRESTSSEHQELSSSTSMHSYPRSHVHLRTSDPTSPALDGFDPLAPSTSLERKWISFRKAGSIWNRLKRVCSRLRFKNSDTMGNTSDPQRPEARRPSTARSFPVGKVSQRNADTHGSDKDPKVHARDQLISASSLSRARSTSSFRKMHRPSKVETKSAQAIDGLVKSRSSDSGLIVPAALRKISSASMDGHNTWSSSDEEGSQGYIGELRFSEDGTFDQLSSSLPARVTKNSTTLHDYSFSLMPRPVSTATLTRSRSFSDMALRTISCSATQNRIFSFPYVPVRQSSLPGPESILGKSLPYLPPPQILSPPRSSDILLPQRQ